MNNTVIFPGSFDPLTLGHVQIIKESLKLFNTVIIAIGINDNKTYMFNIEERIALIQSVFKSNNNIIIKPYSQLTIKLCLDNNAKYIIRGLRDIRDFNYELDIALANKALNHNIQTIFIPTNKEHMHISSSIVKELIRFKGNLEQFVPKEVQSTLISLNKI
tara:strand:- start:38 stop:520 length:483 start_codon:yes stop_codon:yes gene_type:complete